MIIKYIDVRDSLKHAVYLFATNIFTWCLVMAGVFISLLLFNKVLLDIPLLLDYASYSWPLLEYVNRGIFISIYIIRFPLFFVGMCSLCLFVMSHVTHSSYVSIKPQGVIRALFYSIGSMVVVLAIPIVSGILVALLQRSGIFHNIRFVRGTSNIVAYAFLYSIYYVAARIIFTPLYAFKNYSFLNACIGSIAMTKKIGYWIAPLLFVFSGLSNRMIKFIMKSNVIGFKVLVATILCVAVCLAFITCIILFTRAVFDTETDTQQNISIGRGDTYE